MSHPFNVTDTRSYYHDFARGYGTVRVTHDIGAETATLKLTRYIGGSIGQSQEMEKRLTLAEMTELRELLNVAIVEWQ